MQLHSAGRDQTSSVRAPLFISANVECGAYHEDALVTRRKTQELGHKAENLKSWCNHADALSLVEGERAPGTKSPGTKRPMRNHFGQHSCPTQVSTGAEIRSIRGP